MARELGRREFLRNAAAAGGLAGITLLSSSSSVEEVDIDRLNKQIQENRSVNPGQNAYAGTVNKLYDEVGYFPGELLGKVGLAKGLVESELGENPTQKELESLGWKEMYSDLGLQIDDTLEPKSGFEGPFRGPNHDFPELRLMQDKEAEIHVIPLERDYGLEQYSEGLASDMESLLDEELPGIKIDINPANPVSADSQEERFVETQREYLDSDPSVIQWYLTTEDIGVGGYSTPNYSLAVTQIPDTNPGDWSEEMEKWLLHTGAHEAIGHSLLDFQFHDFSREGIMSYNEEGPEYPLGFEGPERLWIENYLDSDLKVEKGEKTVSGETIENYTFELEPGTVSQERDVEVAQDHLKTLFNDRYDVNPQLIVFKDYRKERQPDENWNMEEIVDVHTVEIGGDHYEIPVDHYPKEIRASR